MQLDHVFLACRGRHKGSTAELSADVLAEGSRANAWEIAKALELAGFSEGPGNSHPGQGTANRRFFFERFMFELLFVDDTDALAQAFPLLSLPQRFGFASDLASPFGVGLRPSVAKGEQAKFQSVEYRPEYLPKTAHIDVIEDCAASDPLIFHLPFLEPFAAISPDAASVPHVCGAVRLHSMGMALKKTPSAGVQTVMRQIGIRCHLSDVDRLSLCFETEDGRSELLVDTPTLSVSLVGGVGPR